MKIIIGSDKSGFALKEAIKEYLKSTDNQFSDVGTQSMEVGVPFFNVAPIAATAIQNGEADCAILICGTGMGMSQVANKYKSVRAAVVESVYSAKMCRAINDSNVLCLGGWMIAPELGLEMVKTFLATSFTENLEQWRIDFLKNAKISFSALEDKIYN